MHGVLLDKGGAVYRGSDVLLLGIVGQQ